MKINRDFFDNPIIPDYILCKSNKERIGIMKCTEKNINFNFNDLDEINFVSYLYMDGTKNLLYDAIDVMKYVLLPNIGFFCITSVSVKSESTDFEYKEITAKSYECLLAQKYLEEFVINMGTAESLDGIQFYNLHSKDKSLLHLILEKCPDWEIGHVDASLMTKERSFEISRQDIYSFLNNDVAEAFGCFFLFDTINNTINIYVEENVGKDTNIHISYINLLKNTNLSCTADNIKTCLTVTGSDDLTVREVNMGYDKIYNFGYYNSTAYMSQRLYDAYNKWIALRKSKLPEYTSLLSQYQSFYTQLNYLQYEKMPTIVGSTNWTEYGLHPLKEQLAVYEQQQSVSMKAGHGDPSSKFYQSEYLPLYNAIQEIKEQIKVIENQINSLQLQQSSVSAQMSAIINMVSMPNNFTVDELEELTSFIREDELSSSNYVVTDAMSDSEKFEMLDDLLKFGEKELARISIPQLSFDADMVNLFEIPEFESFHGDFDPGNYIWVTLRDDFSIKAKLLSIHINFYDPTDFSVTFGNVGQRSKGLYENITDILNSVKSISSTVSFNSSHWSQSAKDTSTLGKILDEGLIAAGKYLKNGDDSEMIIDTRGIFVNTISGDYAYKDSIFVGGGRILFTSDNWETVSMSVGRADVTINGTTESRFGTFADFVIAGYIGGSILEGDQIIGGTLKSTNYSKGKTGSVIDLNNGTFEFNANNESKLTLENGILSVKGTIKADLGYIGGPNGFTIMSQKLYSSKASLTSNANGVYIGTDGIALGANNKLKALPDGTLYAEKGYFGGTNGFVLEANKIYNGKTSILDAKNGIYFGTDGIALGANSLFVVTPQGHLTSKSGSIGGAVIANDSIHSSNNNWWINSNGSASFKNVTISDKSTYGSTINKPFGGTTIPHIEELAVNQITADRIKARALEAGFITANSISANYATITSLNASNARIKQIETTYITASTVSANYATITSLSAVDAKVNNIAANYITTSQLNAVNANLQNLISDKASISSLNATNAEIENLKINKLSVGDFNAQTISAMGIKVQSANVVGGFSASKITSGTISADRIDVDELFSTISSISAIGCGNLNVATSLWYRGRNLDFKTINGVTYVVA